MRYEMIMFSREYENLRKYFSETPNSESFGVGLAKKSSGCSHIRLLVTDLMLPEAKDYSQRSAGVVSPTKDFMTRAYKRCCFEQKHFIKFHSHVGCILPRFSTIDDTNDMKNLFPYFNRVLHGLVAASVVTNTNITELDGRICLCDKNEVHPFDLIKIIAPEQMRLFFPYSSPLRNTEMDIDTYSRNILVFGQNNQKCYSVLRFVIGGVGGLGCIIAEQAVRLPVAKIILIDPDVVEPSNENRLLGSTHYDAINKTPKVEALKRHIWQINPDVDVVAIQESIFDAKAQEVAKQADIFWGCFDDPAARLAINRLAVAHGIPYFDLGSGIKVTDEKIEHVAGQIYKIVPSAEYCLHCLGSFSSWNTTISLFSKEKREALKKAGYIQGAYIPHPSVYFLNLNVASYAMWMFMRYCSGIGCKPGKIFSELLNWKLESAIVDTSQTSGKCPVCSRGGLFAQGDEIPLMNKIPDTIVEEITKVKIGETNDKSRPDSYKQTV